MNIFVSKYLFLIQGVLLYETTSDGTVEAEYAVRAYEASGVSSGFNSADVLIDWAPATPTVTATVAGNGTVTLTWNTIYSATHYDVRRRVVGGQWVTLTDSLGTTTFVDTTAPEGNLEYSVRAFEGTTASGFTAVGVLVDLPIAAPTLSATVQANGSVQLTWNAVTGAQGYELVRQTAGSANLEVVVSQWYGTSFVDTAPPEGNVLYMVRAKEGATYSEYGSAAVFVTPQPIVVSDSSVSATTLSDQTVHLDWNAATNATGYNVFRRVAGGSWVQVNSQPLTDTEFTDTTPPLGTVEYYVTAVKGTSTVNLSTTSTTVALAAPVASANVETSGEVTITWDAVNNAARYSVWVKVAGGTWTQLSSNATGGSFVHTNPAVGTAQYAVKAHNGTIVSGFTAVTVNVPAPSSATTTTLPPFGAPVVNAALQNDGSVSIAWGEVEDATRYSVWYQEAGGTWTLLSSNATGGSFVQTNPPSGTVKYTVKAHNGTVVSGFVAVILSIP